MFSPNKIVKSRFFQELFNDRCKVVEVRKKLHEELAEDKKGVLCNIFVRKGRGIHANFL